MAEKKWHSFRKLSREDYGSKLDADNIKSTVFDPVAKGAILRIADALEIMTKDKDDLVKENFAFKKTNVALQEELEKATRNFKAERSLLNSALHDMARKDRQIRAYKGVITKLNGKPVK